MERILSILEDVPLEDVLGESLCRLIMCIMRGESCSRWCARSMKWASSWFSIKIAEHFQKMYQTSSKGSTISDVAAQAGVSIPTVSRVLNGRPDVAPATRARIEQILEESGYVHSKAARGLSKGSSRIIDLLVPGLDNPHVTEIIRGVEEALRRTGLRLALSFTQDVSFGERLWLLRNIHVPEHMSVIGFDDIPSTTIVSPSLTSMRQPLFDMGRVATTMLMRLIVGEPLDSPRVELATTLFTRESCAPPSSPSLKPREDSQQSTLK